MTTETRKAAPDTISKRTDFLNVTLLGALDYCGYWGDVTNYKSDRIEQYTGEIINRAGERYEPWTGRYHSASADVKDVERPGGEWVHVDEKTIEKGIELILAGGGRIHSSLAADVFQANLDNDGGLIDGPLADCILQAAMFGEVIYG